MAGGIVALMRGRTPEEQRWTDCQRQQRDAAAALEEQFMKERASALGVPYVPPTDRWSRTDAGDVLNLSAFNRHMDSVGEEDQSEPGWDHGA